jgi:hypothetical protein
MKTNIENVAVKYLQNFILEHIKKRMPIESIIEHLNLRCDNMFKSLEKRQDDLDLFSKLFLGFENANSERIDKRIRYMFFYITKSKEQIDNLNWILKNKDNFDLNDQSFYKLCLFKDKISKKNAISLPF